MASRADAVRAFDGLPPVLVAVLAHVGSTLALLALHAYGPAPIPGAAWPWAQGVVAAAIGAAAGLPWWWAPINLAFFPAAGMLLAATLPPAAFLAAFGLLFITNLTAWRTRAPLFLSSSKAARAVAALLPPGAGFRLVDLGCGTGSLLGDLARARPDGRYTGIELAPLSYLMSRWRARRDGGIAFKWGDFWREDLGAYDVVYAYLSPVPMAQLWEKARREMRPGSLFVSNGFCVPGVEPAQTIPLDDQVRSTLYVWRM